MTSVATTFTRLAGFASVLRARVAALLALDVRLLAELFRPGLFLAEVFLPELFLAVLFFEALFLEVVFFEAFFLATLFLAVAPFFLAVPVLRFRVLPPRFVAVALFFAAVLRFLVPVARFLGDALLFDVERARLVLLRPVLRLVALLRPVDFRPADFALEFPRDDFLVVAIHALRLSSRTGVTRSCMASFGRAELEVEGNRFPVSFHLLYIPHSIHPFESPLRKRGTSGAYHDLEAGRAGVARDGVRRERRSQCSH
jgi:hypothetical protein